MKNADIIKGSGILRLADIKLQVNDARGKNKIRIHSVEPFHPVQSNFSGLRNFIIFGNGNPSKQTCKY